MSATKRVEVDFGDKRINIDVPAHAAVVEFRDPEFLPDAVAELNRVLDSPQAGPAFREIVRPGMKVAIAFDDPTRPPVPVQTILPVILTRLVRHGVNERDITLICATGNHRKYSPTELATYLGAEVFNRFAPYGQIVNHDCEDATRLVALGVTPHGGYVEVNRLFAESDLPIYIGNVAATAWGGYTGTGAAVGLASTRSMASHHELRVIGHPSSQSAEHRIHGHHRGHVEAGKTDPVSTLPFRGFKEEINAHIEAATGKRIFYVNAVGGTKGRIAGIFAGYSPEIEPPAWALADTFSRYEAPEADVMIFGLSASYSYGSSHNPLIAAVGVLVPPRQWLNKPVLREGGVVIGLCPSSGTIDARIFPSYQEVIDLYGRYHDAAPLVDHQEEVIHRPEYLYRYRHAFGYPAVHPFWLFYENEATMSRAGRVIMAGATNPHAFRALDIAPVRDFEGAWRMACRIVGPNPRTIVAPAFWSRRMLKFDVRD